jgi:hypothetical protein
MTTRTCWIVLSAVCLKTSRLGTPYLLYLLSALLVLSMAYTGAPNIEGLLKAEIPLIPLATNVVLDATLKSALQREILGM